MPSHVSHGQGAIDMQWVNLAGASSWGHYVTLSTRNSIQSPSSLGNFLIQQQDLLISDEQLLGFLYNYMVIPYHTDVNYTLMKTNLTSLWKFQHKEYRYTERQSLCWKSYQDIHVDVIAMHATLLSCIEFIIHRLCTLFHQIFHRVYLFWLQSHE